MDGNEVFNVYAYNDDNGQFVLEWDDVSNGEDDQNCPNCINETFQMILYNADVYQTITGDGDILFQYKEIHDIDNGEIDGRWGNYSTIGIESPNQNHGVQYQFRNELEDFYGNQEGSRLVENEMAILFTTDGVNQLSIDFDKDVIPEKIELFENACGNQ